MSIKVLAIIAGVSILVTVGLFLIPRRSTNAPEGDESVVQDGTAQTSEVMDLDSPPLEGKAKITGTICTLEGAPAPVGVLLTAERIPDKKRFSRFIQGPIDESVNYALEVEPGRYEVFTETASRQKLGLYSRFVTCGLDASKCLDHTMVQIEAGEGKLLRDVNTCDYLWAQ